MRVIRILSSERWHDPHFARTSSLTTGMPSSAGGVAAAGACAYAAGTNQRAIAAATQLRTFMKNPFGHQQRQAADDVRQRHRRTALTVLLEQIGQAIGLAGAFGQRHEIDMVREPDSAGKCLLEHDLAAADDRSIFEPNFVRVPQGECRRRPEPGGAAWDGILVV